MHALRSPLPFCLALLLGASLAAGCRTAGSPRAQDTAEAKETEGVSAEASDADALRSALDDEYKAEATYAAVLEAFPGTRPFSNIIEAEKRHSGMAKAEMDRLGIRYDAANPYTGKIDAPATLLAACEAGVKAEIDNIALYDRILPSLSDPQARVVLTRLQSASRDRHLPAFRRCVERGGAPGGGMGRR